MATDRDSAFHGNQIKDRTVTKQELDATGETTEKVATVQSNGSVDWQFIRSLADYKKLQDNDALNAFRIAINGSLTQFNMIDGIVDEYEDESGIDTVNSLNEDYDATDDYYSPTSSALDTSPYAHYKCNDNAASTVVTDDGTGANNGVGNVNTSNYSVSGKINQAFEFNGSTEYINVDALAADVTSDTTGSFTMWIKPTDANESDIMSLAISTTSDCLLIRNHGLAKDYFEIWFSSAASGVLWDISSGIASLVPGTWIHLALVQDGVNVKMYLDSVLAASGSGAESEWFTDLSTLTTGRIGCHNYNNRGNATFFGGQTDDIRYYQNKALTQSEINTLYNSGNGTEDDKPTGDSNNMTLISDTFTAEVESDSARIVFLEEDVDAITLNSDIKIFISRDAGITYTQATLSDEGDYDASKRVLVGNADISGQPTGTSMKYKLTSHNNKDFKAHANSLNWA